MAPSHAAGAPTTRYCTAVVSVAYRGRGYSLATDVEGRQYYFYAKNERRVVQVDNTDQLGEELTSPPPRRGDRILLLAYELRAHREQDEQVMHWGYLTRAAKAVKAKKETEHGPPPPPEVIIAPQLSLEAAVEDICQANASIRKGILGLRNAMDEPSLLQFCECTPLRGADLWRDFQARRTPDRRAVTWQMYVETVVAEHDGSQATSTAA